MFIRTTHVFSVCLFQIAFSILQPGGGVLPILRYTCMCRANAPVFGHFFSLFVEKIIFCLFVPQLNLIILSFIEEEISHR